MELAYLKDELEKTYGGLTEKILSGLSAQRKTTLRVNTLRYTEEQVFDQLRAAGLSFEAAPGIPGAYVLPPRSEGALRKLPAYEAGGFYMQSLSSMLPVLFLSPQPGEDVLDMAAAPGGKTSQICQLTGGQAFVTACEVQHIRAERLRANMKRLGCARVTVLEQDARKLDDFLRFDRILLDAPCSGSGTLDLTDEASCKAFSKKLVQNSARLQKELLRKAARLLKKGGTLVYSTCSVLDAENGLNVRDLSSLGLRPDPIPLEGLPPMPLLPSSVPGTLTVCPDETYEGFFVARFRKEG